MTLDVPVPRYRWPNSKKWAFAVSVDVDGESPLLWRWRDKPDNNIAELEQRRFGPKTGVYRIADVLLRNAFPCTFFVPAFIAETYDNIVPTLAGEGFEVGLHGYLHEYPDELGSEALAELTARSITLLAEQSAQTKFGHRAPGWRVTEQLISTLVEQKVIYDSSLMGNDVPYVFNGLLQIPVHWVWDDSPFLRYTGANRNSWYPPRNEDIETVWRDECLGIEHVGGLMVLTLHPWNTGRGSRLLLLDRFLKWVRGFSNVWIADLRQVALHHEASQEEHT